jgi:hypothetical protein
MVNSSAWDFLKEAATDPNPWRLTARIIIRLQAQGHLRWDSALASVTRASQRLVALVRYLASREDRFSLISFSLGCRIAHSALRITGDPGPNMFRAVFAGAAMSSSSYAALAPSLLERDRVVNVYSDDDAVLQALYPSMHGLDDAAGARAAEVEGVHNVRVAAGHLSYADLADLLVTLGTEPTAGT